jgi:hypothetical protein
VTENQQEAALRAMTAAMEAAAFYGLALNEAYPPKDRLACALKALEHYAPDDPTGLVVINDRHRPHCNPGCVPAMHNMGEGPHDHHDNLGTECEVCE